MYSTENGFHDEAVVTGFAPDSHGWGANGAIATNIVERVRDPAAGGKTRVFRATV